MTNKRAICSVGERTAPAPGIIAADIVADLKACLEQFAAIEEDLKE